QSRRESGSVIRRCRSRKFRAKLFKTLRLDNTVSRSLVMERIMSQNAVVTNPYDYENREGTLPISWNDFHGICRALAIAVSAYQPDLILPIGRGGFYPGT